MKTGITMRDLQKISARGIEALPRATAIRNGKRTVGFLVPIRKAPIALIEEAMRLVEAERAARSPEDEALITEALRDHGIE